MSDDARVPFGSLALYEQATQEIYQRDYGDLVQMRQGRREFLAIRLGSECYGLDLRRVREVARPAPITPVPFSPGWVLGVMALRGGMVPVFHLGRLIGLPGTAAAVEPRARVLMVARPENLVGLLVDEVLEVAAIPEEDLGPAPTDQQGGYITGVARGQRSRILLLDHARLAGAGG